MATLSSTTGHSPKGERKVAGILYISISIAVLAGLLLFFFASSNKELNPYKADRPNAAAPDVPAGEGGPRPGAVAVPEPETAPPTSNPSDKNQ